MVDDEEHPHHRERQSSEEKTVRSGSDAATNPVDSSKTQPLRRNAKIDAAFPERIGNYRILGLIGEGGMGTVYEAEQERPTRKVALKVIRAGFVSENRRRRFEHEAQVLGRLQHPGIAQVFEAGMADTASGPQPFFAMEYVEGHTLGEHIGRESPSVRERLELVARICDAVQHAHQKGVIHRDLKPGNILVDSSGHPKILDFGVARATDSDVQMTTMQTAVGQLIGTLSYMSPEQAAADPHELDTRSDVYALGVILYEVLAEKLPYDLSNRRIHEAAQVIQQQDPTSLSTISRVFRGDVETIVVKALEKDKSRRYQSAEQLAEDIRRYLRDEPIVARPPSTLYQLRKFAKRNRALVTGVVAAFVALSAGLIVSVSQYLRAESQRVLAEGARDEAEAVTDFLSDMLASVDPAELGREVSVREVMDAAAQSVGQQFADQPRIEARLRLTIGNTYDALGEYDAMEPHLIQALDIREREFGEEHTETLESMHALANGFHSQGRYAEAETLLVETLEKRRRLLGGEHPSTLDSIALLALLYTDQGRYDEAEPFYVEGFETRKRVLGERHPETLASMHALARGHHSQGHYDEAVTLGSRAIVMQQETLGERHPKTLESMHTLARCYHSQGRYSEAETLLLRTLEMQKEVLGKEHYSTLRSMLLLSGVYTGQGRYEDAEILLLEASETCRRVLGEEHLLTLQSMANLTHVYRLQGRHDKAEALAREAMPIERRVLGVEHPRTWNTIARLASAYLQQGRYGEAEALYREILSIRRRVLGDDHRASNNVRYYLACCVAPQARHGEAIQFLSDALEHGYHDPRITDDSRLASLHGDPEFEAIVAEVRRRNEEAGKAAAAE